MESVLMCKPCALAAPGNDADLNPLPLRRPCSFAARALLEADLRRRAFPGGAAAVPGMLASFGLKLRAMRAQTPSRPGP
jgi:hypothetical protein